MQTAAPVAGVSLRLNSWQSPLQSSVDSRLWCKDFEAVLCNTILWAEVHWYRPRDRGVGWGGRAGEVGGGWEVGVVLPAHSTHCKSNCTLTVLKTTTMTVTMACKCHLFLSLSWLFLTIWLMQYSLSWFSSVRRRSKVTKVEFSSIPSWINLPPACTRVVCEGGSGGGSHISCLTAAIINNTHFGLTTTFHPSYIPFHVPFYVPFHSTFTGNWHTVYTPKIQCAGIVLGFCHGKEEFTWFGINTM